MNLLSGELDSMKLETKPQDPDTKISNRTGIFGLSILTGEPSNSYSDASILNEMMDTTAYEHPHSIQENIPMISEDEIIKNENECAFIEEAKRARDMFIKLPFIKPEIELSEGGYCLSDLPKVTLVNSHPLYKSLIVLEPIYKRIVLLRDPIEKQQFVWDFTRWVSELNKSLNGGNSNLFISVRRRVCYLMGQIIRITKLDAEVLVVGDLSLLAERMANLFYEIERC